MKNQYCGDVGDYGKYGLLRYLASCGLTIAVNWYLTPDDPSSNHGNIRGYLEKEKDRKFDAGLYDELKALCAQKPLDVCNFEARRMIPNAVYYSRRMPSCTEHKTPADHLADRSTWHDEARRACSTAKLVFLDPDVGLRNGSPSAGRDANQYVYAPEVCDYYDMGQDVVFYCHKGRRNAEQWRTARLTMKTYRRDAALFCLTYHRGMQTSYIFMVHPERADQYRRMIDGFMSTAWRDVFTEEPCE